MRTRLRRALSLVLPAALAAGAITCTGDNASPDRQTGPDVPMLAGAPTSIKISVQPPSGALDREVWIPSRQPTVVVKEDHALIRSGPYRRVRHPIYTGMLLAFLGTAVAVGEWRGLVGFVLAFVSFLLKSRMEEARMAETFPEYAEYRRRTASLIPGVY